MEGRIEMKNYVIRHGDSILIMDSAVENYDGNFMFNVYKDERGKYCALSLSGEAYPFPVDSIMFIRTPESWWEVEAIHCELEDLEKNGDATYDIHPASFDANMILDFFLYRYNLLD